MGGLLELYRAEGVRARFVGWCPAGAFALDQAGSLLWVADWGWVGNAVVQGSTVLPNGRAVDLETGERLA
ncbi:MAG: hypothetical protein HOW73_24175 [Polyangiaceae bacterium]|nr:hypothetical protein [Polyangiaceae bacterium]